MRLWPAAAAIVLLWLVFTAFTLVEQNRQEMSGAPGRPLAAVSVSRETIIITWFDDKLHIARPDIPGWDEVRQAFKDVPIFRPY